MCKLERSKCAEPVANDGLSGIDDNVGWAERVVTVDDQTAGPDRQLGRREVVALDVFGDVEDTVGVAGEEFSPDDEALLFVLGVFAARAVAGEAEIDDCRGRTVGKSVIDPGKCAILRAREGSRVVVHGSKSYKRERG